MDIGYNLSLRSIGNPDRAGFSGRLAKSGPVVSLLPTAVSKERAWQ